MASTQAVDGRTFTIRADGTIMLPVGAEPPSFDESKSAGDRRGRSHMCRQWRMLDEADVHNVDLAELWN